MNICAPIYDWQIIIARNNRALRMHQTLMTDTKSNTMLYIEECIYLIFLASLIPFATERFHE